MTRASWLALVVGVVPLIVSIAVGLPEGRIVLSDLSVLIPPLSFALWFSIRKSSAWAATILSVLLGLAFCLFVLRQAIRGSFDWIWAFLLIGALYVLTRGVLATATIARARSSASFSDAQVARGMTASAAGGTYVRHRRFKSQLIRIAAFGIILLGVWTVFGDTLSSVFDFDFYVPSRDSGLKRIVLTLILF